MIEMYVSKNTRLPETQQIMDKLDIKIKESINNINNLTLEEVVDILYNIRDYESYLQPSMLYNPHNSTSIQKRKVVSRIKELEPSIYRQDLVISGEEKINGYELYHIEKSLFFYTKFQKYLALWNNDEVNKKVKDQISVCKTILHSLPDDIINIICDYSYTTEMTKEEFLEQYEDKACSDWSKMDEHGTSYGGFWWFPEGSYEYENAYKLSREKSGLCLWSLPYPKRFLLETIDIGCLNRMESVRYSNFVCEWMKRKIEQMNIYQKQDLMA